MTMLGIAEAKGEDPVGYYEAFCRTLVIPEEDPGRAGEELQGVVAARWLALMGGQVGTPLTEPVLRALEGYPEGYLRESCPGDVDLTVYQMIIGIVQGRKDLGGQDE